MASLSIAARPPLSFWQIWNMSFGFLGIQFGFAIQNANTSRIFSTLGAEESELPILWLAAPMTGLLVQPIIGYLSDRTWHPRFGRRRPYFLVGAILASVALCLMPNSSTLWMAAGMLWIMDASINISMEPFRAFVGDVLPPSQRTTGFAMQSFFIGIGAVVGSNLPWLYSNVFGFENTAENQQIPPNIVASYYTGALIFLAAVLWTVITSKEYPPEENEKEHDRFRYGQSSKSHDARSYLVRGTGLTLVGVALAIWFYFGALEKELYVLCGIFGLFGIAYIIASTLMRRGQAQGGFVQMVIDFQTMPGTMRQLAVVQFFTWFALFSMWIYTTSAVTTHVFGSADPQSKAYNDGADWVTVLFSIYNGVGALTALFIPYLAKNTNRRVTHLIALTAGGIGLISIFFIKTPSLLIFSMVGVGIAWASILSMPYAMLASSLPPTKMGYYMGIFNFFIVIPQIVAASVLGFLVSRLFAGDSIYAFLIGGASMILAGMLTLRVVDKDEPGA